MYYINATKLNANGIDGWSGQFEWADWHDVVGQPTDNEVKELRIISDNIRIKYS